MSCFAECRTPRCRRVAAGAFNGGLIARGAATGAHYNYRPAPPAVLERLAALERAAGGPGRICSAAAIQFVLRHRRRVAGDRRLDGSRSRGEPCTRAGPDPRVVLATGWLTLRIIERHALSRGNR